MDENLVEYQQMLKAADAQMAKEIEDMTNGKYVRILIIVIVIFIHTVHIKKNRLQSLHKFRIRIYVG